MPSATSPSAPYTRWEYISLKFAAETGFFGGTDFDSAGFTEELDKLGAEGWELVSTFAITRHEGGSKFVNAVLKRPR